MARATVTLPQDLLTELLSLVDAKSKTEAVITAIKDEIRLRRAARIKAMAGQMEFTAEAEELRHGDQCLFPFRYQAPSLAQSGFRHN